jgi:hypothetical protein
VDRSISRLTPERLFRRQPAFDFGRGEARMNWRDLTLPERALPDRAPRSREV